MRRILIVCFLIVLPVLAIPFVGPTLLDLWLRYELFRLDPLPTFMTELDNSPTYDGRRMRFAEIAGKTFPIGSDPKDAIAQTTGQGFEIRESTGNSIELRLERRAGICTDHYLIMIDLNADGTTANATGRLHAICL